MTTRAERRSPTQDRAARTRASILDAAERLLTKREPGSLTTRAIAEEAGVPIGSVYRYFADVRAVLRALFERLNDRTVTALETALAEPAPYWRDDLKRIAAVVRRTHEMHPVYGVLMRHVEPDGGSEDGPIARTLQQHLSRARPDLPASKVDSVARTVLALFIAIEQRYYAVPVAERPVAFAEGVIAVEAYLATYLDTALN